MKRLKSQRMIRSLATMFQSLMLLTSVHVYASEDASIDAHSQQIESVLDKLEKRMMDQEGTPYTYGEVEGISKERTKPVDEKQSKPITQNKPIIGKPIENRTLDEIDRKIQQQDAGLEKLETSTRLMRENLLDQSTTDNQVTIEVKLTDPKNTALQSLVVRVDGSLVFNQTASSAMWIPEDIVPIYKGPMQPGAHTIKVDATLVRIEKNGLPLLGWAPQSISKQFSFEIKTGKHSSNLSVDLETTENKSGKAVATLRELIQ